MSRDDPCNKSGSRSTDRERQVSLEAEGNSGIDFITKVVLDLPGLLSKEP